MKKYIDRWMESYGNFNPLNFAFLLLVTLPMKFLLDWLHAGHRLQNTGQKILWIIGLSFCLRVTWRLYQNAGIRIVELLLGAAATWVSLALIEFFLLQIHSESTLNIDKLALRMMVGTALLMVVSLERRIFGTWPKGPLPASRGEEP